MWLETFWWFLGSTTGFAWFLELRASRFTEFVDEADLISHLQQSDLEQGATENLEQSFAAHLISKLLDVILIVIFWWKVSHLGIKMGSVLATSLHMFHHFSCANKQHILSKSLASPISWPRSLATYSAKVIAATRLGCVHTTTWSDSRIPMFFETNETHWTRWTRESCLVVWHQTLCVANLNCRNFVASLWLWKASKALTSCGMSVDLKKHPTLPLSQRNGTEAEARHIRWIPLFLSKFLMQSLRVPDLPQPVSPLMMLLHTRKRFPHVLVNSSTVEWFECLARLVQDRAEEHSVMPDASNDPVLAPNFTRHCIWSLMFCPKETYQKYSKIFSTKLNMFIDMSSFCFCLLHLFASFSTMLHLLLVGWHPLWCFTHLRCRSSSWFRHLIRLAATQNKRARCTIRRSRDGCQILGVLAMKACHEL